MFEVNSCKNRSSCLLKQWPSVQNQTSEPCPLKKWPFLANLKAELLDAPLPYCGSGPLLLLCALAPLLSYLKG